MHINLLVPIQTDYSSMSAAPRQIPWSPSSMTLAQAAERAPTLAHLMELAQESRARLHAIAPLIPASLFATLSPGPIEQDSWCLLVSSNAAAAKMRQMLPQLQAHLRTKGWQVNAIRLKVQIPAR
jgi:hypothetical protein